MAAADDERPTTEQAGDARTGDGDLDGGGRIDGTASSVKQNIDRVADKVKHLLRSED